MARVYGVALPVSFKQCVEICSFLEKRSVNSTKKLLQDVIDKKTAIPFRRYHHDLGHKTKLGPARYPESASKQILKLIESVEANAQFKGLNTSNLVVVHASAHKAGKAWHFGRKQRRKMKRTNIEIVVEEKTSKENKKESNTKQKNTQ